MHLGRMVGDRGLKKGANNNLNPMGTNWDATNEQIVSKSTFEQNVATD